MLILHQGAIFAWICVVLRNKNDDVLSSTVDVRAERNRTYVRLDLKPKTPELLNVDFALGPPDHRRTRPVRDRSTVSEKLRYRAARVRLAQRRLCQVVAVDMAHLSMAAAMCQDLLPGLYTLRSTVVQKAGHEYKQIYVSE